MSHVSICEVLCRISNEVMLIVNKPENPLEAFIIIIVIIKIIIIIIIIIKWRWLVLNIARQWHWRQKLRHLTVFCCL